MKEIAYITYVRPIVEYACPVWDPVQKVLINKQGKAQNRAVRSVMGQYDHAQSYALVNNKLNWDTLEAHHRKLRFELFNTIFHNETGIDALKYFKDPHYVSKHDDHFFKITAPGQAFLLFFLFFCEAH